MPTDLYLRRSSGAQCTIVDSSNAVLDAIPRVVRGVPLTLDVHLFADASATAQMTAASLPTSGWYAIAFHSWEDGVSPRIAASSVAVQTDGTIRAAFTVTNTSELSALLDMRQGAMLTLEVGAKDSTDTTKASIIVQCRMVADNRGPDGVPTAVQLDYYTKTQVDALLANIGTEVAEAAEAAEDAKDEAVTAKTQAISAKDEAVTAKTQTQALHDSIMVINHLPVGHATNIGFYETGTVIHLTCEEPANNTLDDGTVLAYWGKTRFLYKVGSAPENENDGTILFDNTTRNAYKDTEFTYDMGVSASYYFALFTCTTGGTWNTQESAPRWNTTVVSFATIKQLHRSGLPLSMLGLSIGSVVNVQTSDYFPALRWKLADEDYTGCQMSTTGLQHNSIWIPQYLPCEVGNTSALMLNFDAPEYQYGRTTDTAFGTGTYYKLDTGSYVALTAGTDYNVGDSISTWETSTGYYVYQKNDNNRASNGNNRWLWSNMRQYLNATGSGYYQATHKFDKSGFTKVGFKGCFYQSLLDCIEPVYNTVAKPNYDGGGSEKTLDYFWLPSIKEVFNSNNNGYEEGKQFKYFTNVATTAASRIQVDEGGTARNVWLRSPHTGLTLGGYIITTSGSSSYYAAGSAYAFLPAMCIA